MMKEKFFYFPKNIYSLLRIYQKSYENHEYFINQSLPEARTKPKMHSKSHSFTLYTATSLVATRGGFRTFSMKTEC